MKFEVEKEMVEPIIRDQISAAIVAQLGDPKELIRKMVVLALDAKVGRNGKVSKYSSDNNFDFIEALAGNAIREAASEAVRRLVEEQKPAIEDAIMKELKRAPRQTAAAILAGFADVTSSKYRLNVNFQFKADE